MSKLAPRVIAALITPFDQNGELDLSAHAHNLSVLAERGVHGFLMCGSTGEGVYLDPGERQTLLQTARQTLGEEAMLICGITAQSTRASLAQLREAADGGADAGLVVTPTSLIRNRSHLVEDHFGQLAKSTPLPIMLYSVPPVTAYTYPIAQTVRSLNLDNVVGMKDSEGNVVRLQQILSGLGEEQDNGLQPLTAHHPLLYNGSSQAVRLAALSGVYGAITASVNYATSLVQQLADQKNGWGKTVSTHQSIAVQSALSEVSSTVEADGVAGVKAAAGMVGLSPGSPRLPLRSSPEAVHQQISSVLKKHELVTV